MYCFFKFQDTAPSPKWKLYPDMVSLASPIHITECTYSVYTASTKGEPLMSGATEIGDGMLKCLSMYFCYRILYKLPEDSYSKSNVQPTDHG